MSAEIIASRRTAVCFLGSAHYAEPLDPTSKRKFSDLGHEITPTVIGLSSSRSIQHFKQEGARFLMLPYPRWLWMRIPLRLIFGIVAVVWTALRWRCAVVVAQSPFDGISAVLSRSVLRLLRRDLRVIVENHADFEVAPMLQSSEGGVPGPARRVLAMAARFAISRADGLRAVSGSTRDQFIGVARTKKIYQFPTWTDIDVFLEDTAARDLDPPAVLFAGVMIPRKGVEHLIEAVARMVPDRQVLVRLAGDETDIGYVKELKTKIATHDLEERVEWLGKLDQAELAEVMRNSTVFVLPTYSEGLPRVLFEAMAAGLPCIASNVSGIPEVLTHGVTGYLVDPKAPEQIESCLRQIIDNPSEAALMGDRARERARQIFSRESYVSQYAAMVRDVLN